MKLGYARVSTVGQDLETQIEKLKSVGVSDQFLYIEKISGKSTRSREQLKLLLKSARSGDHVYVTKVDRLARSILDLNKIVNKLIERGTAITFIDHNITFQPHSESDSMQTLIFNILGAFAQFERDLIVSRTGEGRHRAIKSGKKMGRKGQAEKNIIRALQLYKEREHNGMSVSEISKLTGVPRSSIYAEIKKREH